MSIFVLVTQLGKYYLSLLLEPSFAQTFLGAQRPVDDSPCLRKSSYELICSKTLKSTLNVRWPKIFGVLKTSG